MSLSGCFAFLDQYHNTALVPSSLWGVGDSRVYLTQRYLHHTIIRNAINTDNCIATSQRSGSAPGGTWVTLSYRRPLKADSCQVPFWPLSPLPRLACAPRYGNRLLSFSYILNRYLNFWSLWIFLAFIFIINHQIGSFCFDYEFRSIIISTCAGARTTSVLCSLSHCARRLLQAS